MNSSEDEPTDLPAIKWRVRLSGSRQKPLFVIFGAALIGGAAGDVMFRSPVMGLLGFAMILASTADYWLGAHYLVNAKGIQSRIGLSLSAMEWKDVKRVVIEPMAVKISPLNEGEKMDAFRGVVLRTNDAVRTRVLEQIRGYVSSEVVYFETDQEFPR